MSLTPTTSRPTIGTGTQRWIGGFGVLLYTGALTMIAGPAGILVGVALVVTWYEFSAVIGFAFGHIALLLFPALLSSPYLLVIEAGLTCLLLSSTVDENEPWRIGIGMVLSFAVLGMVAWFGQRLFGTLWSIALLLTVIVLVIAYGFHRYERLKIGLMEKS